MKFSQIQVIFIALAIGQLAFAAVVYFMFLDQETQGEFSFFKFVVPIVMVSGAIGSYLFNEQGRSKASQFEAPIEKFNHYRTRVIVRLALVEGGNLLALVAALLTGEYTYLLYFLFGMAVFFYFRPTLFEIEDDYQLKL